MELDTGDLQASAEPIGRHRAVAAGQDHVRLAPLIYSAAIFIVSVALVAALGFAGMEVSNITRAYAAGEAQYSKAQKEVVIGLMRYAQSGTDKDYARLQGPFEILHGDRKARLALEANDLERAAEGILQGGNPPQDVPALIIGFRVFHRWPPFAAAVDDWRIADAQFVRLEQLAWEIRARVVAGGRVTPEQLAELERLDHVASRSEERFSKQMGFVARQVIALAYLLIGGLSLLIGVVGMAAGWRLQRVLLQASAQLAEGKRLAEDANQAKGDFLASMSHEIRTPLTGIMGFAHLLKTVGGLPPRAGDYVGHIETAGQALLVVVNDILDFSKIDAGRVELEPQPFEPRMLLSETLALVAAQAEGKGLALTLDIDPAVPNILRADPARLRQIVLNLLNNAVKFTGEGLVALSARYEPDVRRLRVGVKDTGPGVPADRLDRLFRRFSQADGSVSRRYGGTGLGLAICKSLSELMGGEIGVVTREGEGAEFWFTVEAPPAAASAHRDLSEVFDPGEATGARLLVVDDTAINRELIGAMLAPFGHRVVEADGGAQGVAIAETEDFDLILMDLQMPNMDGLAATRAIRQGAGPNRRTPILAISANVLPAQVASCLAAGMNDHIAKPIRPAELLAKVEGWAGAPVDDQIPPPIAANG
ncbi:ATP-binding protein [Phenylobacterium sp.]|uniref:hybrid sensor histidine kinase/response regulator n=1 Tax=Phenylobacterium sp. TaxID=1871053 RepID=UPI0035AF0D9F